MADAPSFSPSEVSAPPVTLPVSENGGQRFEVTGREVAVVPNTERGLITSRDAATLTNFFNLDENNKATGSTDSVDKQLQAFAFSKEPALEAEQNNASTTPPE